MRASELARRRWHLGALVSRLQQTRVMMARQATAVTRMLERLREQGAPAVTEIDEFLRRGDDVDFAKMAGGQLVGHRTMRQALIDTLEKIGGSAAVGVALDQLRGTREPVEIAMLARGLDEQEPRVHREHVIQAVEDVLRWAEDAPAKASPDVGPLFDVLRGYGGEQAVEILERSVPHWGEYALIALADLPDGAGIPSLTALAATTDAPVANAALPFQILAQSTVEHPEAADALVDLARTGRIPDQMWPAMGQALGGRRLQLSGTMFDGTPLATNGTERGGKVPWKSYYIEWLNVRYEQAIVSAEWSPAQVEQQLSLIEHLLAATSSPAAAEALDQVLASLQPGGR